VVWFLLDPGIFSDTFVQKLHASCRVEASIGELKSQEPVGVINVNVNDVPILRSQAFYSRIQKAQFQFLQEAVQRRPVTSWAKAHAPGVLTYMRSYLREPIPDPDL
jgi:hypothetical protein